MKSGVIKRSIVIDSHKTSVSLENEFWMGLKELAKTRQTTISQLVSSIKAEQHDSNLSSAIRICVLFFYATQKNDLRQG